MAKSLMLMSKLLFALVIAGTTVGCGGNDAGIAPKAPAGSPTLEPAALPGAAPKPVTDSSPK